jgi:Family of unknown function (DUF5681)
MFQKGVSGNYKGRPVGSKNVMVNDLRERLRKSVSIESILDDLDSCKPFERASLKIKLLEYLIPRLRTIEIRETSTIEALLNMTPEERRIRILELKNNTHEKE